VRWAAHMSARWTTAHLASEVARQASLEDIAQRGHAASERIADALVRAHRNPVAGKTAYLPPLVDRGGAPSMKALLATGYPGAVEVAGDDGGQYCRPGRWLVLVGIEPLDTQASADKAPGRRYAQIPGIQ